MSFIEISSDGTLNGTTPVTLVAAPAANTRRIVKNVTIQNRDTASVTLTLNYVNGASTRQIASMTLQVGDSLVCGEEDFYVLDTTSKSITAVLSASPATTNPDYCVTYADANWDSTLGGAAGGSLAGSYPNPIIASGRIQSGLLASGAIANVYPIFGYLAGLNTSYTSGSTAGTSGTVYITRGVCADTSGTYLMYFASGIKKTLGTTWASGTGNSAGSIPFFSGRGAIHVFAISDGNVSDIMAQSWVTGINPTLPSGMIYSRRIATLYASGACVNPYTQVGNYFLYNGPTSFLDFNQNNSGSSFIQKVFIPLQVKTTWIGAVQLQAAYPTAVWMESPDMASGGAISGKSIIRNPIPAGGTWTIGWQYVQSNVSGMLRVHLNGSGTVFAATLGYVDYRSLEF
jgi:hypothetical protein